MEILEQRQGAVMVLRPKGPLCAGDAEQFKTRALSVIESSMGRLVADLSDVPFADSRGLEVLKEAGDALNASGLGLRLCCANETMREVLELTNLSANFEHYTDVTSAVRSFL